MQSILITILVVLIVVALALLVWLITSIFASRKDFAAQSAAIAAISHSWALRTDAASRMAMSHDRANEYFCLKAAHDAGACVPEPVAVSRDTALIGAPFAVVGLLAGEAQGRKLVHDPQIGQNGDALGERLGAELAKIHSVRPPLKDLEFLDVPETSPALVQVAQMRANLDLISEPRPALEFVLAWLEANAPPRDRVVLCHGDSDVCRVSIGELFIPYWNNLHSNAIVE